LSEAAAHGVAVNPTGLARARAHLAELLAHWDESPLTRAAAPFALDVVAMDAAIDRPSLAVIGKQLVDARETLPLFARAHLLHALAGIPTTEGDQATLLTSLEASLQLDGPIARVVDEPASLATHRNDDGLGSPLRTSALVLRGLLAARPTHPFVTPLALGLVRERQRGTWRTTQETAWALLALDAYRSAQPRARAGETVQGEVSFAGTAVLQRAFVPGAGAGLGEERTVEVPMATLRALAPAGAGGSTGWSLIFGAKGGAPVHYQARLTFAPTSLPTDDLDAGIELHRRYYVVPPDALQKGLTLDELPLLPEAEAAAHVPEGSFLVVALEATTGASRRFVALADPLPGGFEAAELDLRQEGGWLHRFVDGRSTRREQHDDRVVMFLDEMAPGSHRFTYVIRATGRGRFLAPPARIEEMYVPETFGRTRARLVTVDPAP
jgi:alpha-2-macroglobulin